MTDLLQPDLAPGFPPPDDALLPDFTWRLGSSWNTGFTAYIDIVNDTDTVMEDFSIRIPNPGFEITNIWGGEVEELANGDLLITGVSWTKNLKPGETVSLGFNGAGPVPDTGTMTYTVDLEDHDDVVVNPDPVDPDPVDPDPVVPDPVDTGDGPTVAFRITSDWGSGFNAEITVTNDTDVAIEDWSILIEDAGFTIRNAWGATYDNEADGDVLLEATGWTLDLSPGESQSFGFTADGTVPAGTPAMVVNGESEDTGTGDPGDGPGDTDGGGGNGDDGSGSDGGGETEDGPVPTVAFRITSDWGNGFNAEITLTNDTGAHIDDWSILIEDAGFAIRNIWGATYDNEADGDVLLEASDWTLDLDPGETQSFGFTADGTVPNGSPGMIITADGSTGTVDPGDPGDPGDGGTGGGVDPGTVDPTGSPFDAGDYGDALSMSMQFYYAQYSGDLPDDFPLDWRGDSALGDGADVGVDLTGGWYDAGDHVKFGLPMAFSSTMLAWGAADYAEGYAAAGADTDILNHLEWVTDYFLRAYDDKGTADLSDDVFYAQVGDGDLDHSFWGAPEDMTMNRPTFAVTAQNPGTEVTAETAAALASASIVFRDAGNTAYADELLDTAIQLFDFAETYQGSYADAIPQVRNFYNSFSGYEDELSWAAAWLHEATGEASYLNMAKDYYPGASTGWALAWDDKANGAAMLLAEATGEVRYKNDIDAHLNQMITSVDRTPGTDTNAGLAWLDQWGSNRYAANMAFVAVERASLAEEDGDDAYAALLRDFASDQIDYMLGDNPNGQSYVVGFGDTYPLNPHHRAASGTTNLYDGADNLHTLTGALVGGPDRNGNYSDDRWDYVQNEVATDYNAGFSGALAGLVAYDMG